MHRESILFWLADVPIRKGALMLSLSTPRIISILDESMQENQL